MADYPASIFAAMTRGALMSDAVTQSVFVEKLQEELRAALQTLGVNPQGGEATVDARLDPMAIRESGTYTPTLTNHAIGTGGVAANTASYLFLGGPDVGDLGWLTITGRILYGTSGATFPNSPSMHLPAGFEMTGVLDAGRHVLGHCIIIDDNLAVAYTGGIEFLAATQLRPFIHGAAGTWLVRGGIVPTAPMAWAAGDSIWWAASSAVVRV